MDSLAKDTGDSSICHLVRKQALKNMIQLVIHRTASKLPSQSLAHARKFGDIHHRKTMKLE
jgi:hypothetical protein